VDRHYVELMERLLCEGNYPAVATHDETIIGAARKFVAREGIGSERFEFQMLYGVRRDLQEQLRAAGHRVRVYVPFGTQWYPYLMRRLAERPANIVFILGNVLREGSIRR
jgi:proline dehydrogenase